MSEPQEKLDISDLKDTFLECPVCVEHFNQTDRRPRLLHSCLHAFCTQCLQQLLDKEGKGQITCPLCRQVQKVKGKADTLPADPVRGKLVEYVQIKHKQRVLCGECEEHDAISRCQECQTYLCKECDFVHKRHRVSKGHPIVSLEEVLQQPVKNIAKGHFCPRHCQHHLEFYCTTDEQLCCVSCTVLDHKGHDLLKLDEAAATRKQELETRMKELYKLADHLKEARKEANQQEKCIADTKAKSLSDIDDMFGNLKKVLDTRKRELVAAVHEKSTSLLSTVQKTSASHEQTLAIIESTATYFTQAKGKADVVEMLQMYPAIKRSVDGLKEPKPTSDFAAVVSDFTFVKKMMKEMEVLVNTLGGFSQSDKDKEVGLKKPIRKRNGYMQNVSLDQFNAVQHLIGQQKFQECCDFESILQDQIKIYFLDNGNESSSVQQRIQGVIQVEMQISVDERDRAKDVASEFVKHHTDAYIKYQEDRNTILMFAEDWDKMARTKKRVSMHFGQSKVLSRGGRRFAGSETAEADSSVKVSFDKNSGCAKGRHIIVRVYKADITNVQTEVIVNAANGYLSHETGVARAIADAAGPTMTREGNVFCQKNGAIKVSHLAITSGGRLPYKMVFHAVGPEWNNYSDKKQCLEDLCNTILRCLCEAEKQDVEFIAIPSISAAIFGVPQELCAKIYVRALKSFDETVDKGSLKEVHFVDISDTMVEEIQKEFQTMWNKSAERDELDRDSAFINRCLGSSNAPPPTDLSTFVSKKWSKETSSKHITETPTKPTIPGSQQISENKNVTVKQGEITDMHADAIVSWEDMLFKTDKPLVKMLMRKGGYQYERERHQMIYKCTKSNTVLVTPGGSLKQKYVLHAVIPQVVNAKVLHSSLEDVFITSLKKGCSTVLLPPYLGVTQGDAVKLFIEAVVHSLRSASSKMPNQRAEVILVDSSDMLTTELMQKLNQHLISLSLDASHDDSDNDCPICQDKAENPKKLECGHVFCTECIDRAFEDKKLCPVCKAVCGTITGTMPPGKMYMKTDKYKHLPGYEAYGTITISYIFSDGMQTDAHPNPGHPYKGAQRIAYLPDTPEGQKVLDLLKVAWDRKLTFTVGRSVTIGGDVDRVTWNEIHHKTNIYGGSAKYGYPDPEYLKRVQEELAQQGVTEADLGATGTSV